MRTMTFVLAPVMWLSVATAAAQSTAGSTPPKSENTALAISLGSTIGLLGLASLQTTGTIPGTLVFAALFAGPSTGYWYGDSPEWHRGMIIRTIAVGASALGVSAFSRCSLFGPSNSGCDTGGFVVLAGAIVVLVSDVTDIVNVRGAVHDANKTRGPIVALLPTIGAGGRSAGVAVRVGF
jgi:hypothetical protein